MTERDSKTHPSVPDSKVGLQCRSIKTPLAEIFLYLGETIDLRVNRKWVQAEIIDVEDEDVKVVLEKDGQKLCTTLDWLQLLLRTRLSFREERLSQSEYKLKLECQESNESIILYVGQTLKLRIGHAACTATVRSVFNKCFVNVTYVDPETQSMKVISLTYDQLLKQISLKDKRILLSKDQRS
jgi:sRNA-binding protein